MEYHGVRVQLKAQSEFWSGDVLRNNNVLRETGLVGSIRWWYEALIRGLGHYACDPSEAGHRCLVKKDEDARCAACELFGCTGWSRKFSLRVLDCRPGHIMAEHINKSDSYYFEFLPLRAIAPAELFLLKSALRIACRYASLGARAGTKPSETEGKNRKRHHRDYGLFEYISTDPPIGTLDKSELDRYFENKKIKTGDNKHCWPDINYFWNIDGVHIDRQKHNRILRFESRMTDEGPQYRPYGGSTANEVINEDFIVWMRGFRLSFVRRYEYWKAVDWQSKKLFSYHTPGAERIWGYSYASEGRLDATTSYLKSHSDFPSGANVNIIEGSEMIREILGV